MTKKQKDSFCKAIMQNYREQGRTFAWRTTTDAYAIMVSEFMLQQTQTSRVVAKYDEWLKKFPTVQDAAKAPLSDILAAWSGLGYNRRAKFLHEACIHICKEYDGHVPSDVEQLDSLPGIGAYTARAIATFAFNQSHVFIETNIRSVYLHFFFADSKEAVSDAQLLPLIEQTLDTENPRQWYYALMDYGSELKKVTVNPSRKSKGYVKQSAFKGSLRQARGAILRQLSQKKRIALEEVCSVENIDMERLQKAAEALCNEKMICLEDGTYVID